MRLVGALLLLLLSGCSFLSPIKADCECACGDTSEPEKHTPLGLIKEIIEK